MIGRQVQMSNVVSFRRAQSRAPILPCSPETSGAELACRVAELHSGAKEEIYRSILLLDLAAQHARQIAKRVYDPGDEERLQRTDRVHRTVASARPRHGAGALNRRARCRSTISPQGVIPIEAGTVNAYQSTRYRCRIPDHGRHPDRLEDRHQGQADLFQRTVRRRIGLHRSTN